MINDNDFSITYGWMKTKLGLKGNELALYSLLYGYTKDGVNYYCNSQSYMAEWLGITRSNTNIVLKKLVEKGYIEKVLVEQKGTKKVYKYRAINPIAETEHVPLLKQNIHVAETEHVPIAETEHNKDIYIYNNNNNISKDISCEKSQVRWKKVIDTWNELGINKLVSINPNTNREKMLKVRIRDYGLDEVLRAIKSIKESDFLMGRVNSFIITFDWFIRPNNFPKVLEGNYIDKRDSINEKDNKKPVENRYGEAPKYEPVTDEYIEKIKEKSLKKLREQAKGQQQENTSKPKNLDELLKKIKL